MTSAARPGHAPFRASATAAEPFASADEAWFWTMAALMARRDGARIVSGAGKAARPCEPDDVIKCLDRLYRQRRIDLQHARILRIWGERQQAPDPRAPMERGDWRLWREAMARLDWPLRVKGILAGNALKPAAEAEILPFPGSLA
ncbi:hypothetical protein [Siccirubricoccus sp. G192]|uniref:hypothetical protein n=1 Tax=Siccirubricoccus sp. G192 TaxID=2849651 RepID=UPI001C2BA233|nr:hypothetical protein [Siccirubricoccus sp. G192]MBV1797237.1 hypothetical protein [Siccirubricoccus sp. G192]